MYGRVCFAIGFANGFRSVPPPSPCKAKPAAGAKPRFVSLGWLVCVLGLVSCAWFGLDGWTCSASVFANMFGCGPHTSHVEDKPEAGAKPWL